MILEQHDSGRAALMDELRERAGWADWTVKYPDKELRLRKILSTVQLANFPGAIVPRLMPGRMVYYALTDSGKQWRMLQGLLRTFVGTTLTDFQGLPSAMDESDPFEAFIVGRLSGPVGRFSPGGIRQLEQSTVDALQRMVELAEGEGRVQRALPRSTRQVLSDFRLALASGNDSAAGEALSFLRQQMRLDSLNLWYLEVERYQMRRDWQVLINAPFFAALTEARRPPKVTNALLEAIYHTEVAPTVAQGQLDPIVAIFRERIRPRYGSLLKVLPPRPEPGVALLFLLEAYLEENPGAPVVAVVQSSLSGLSSPEKDVADRLLDAFGKMSEPATDVDDNEGKRGNLSYTPTPQGAIAIVMSALETGSLAAFQEALEYMHRFSEVEREALLQQRSFRVLWKELTNTAGGQHVPTSWVELLHALPSMRYSEVKALAERAQLEWLVSKQLATPEKAGRLANAIQQAWNAATNELTTLLPYLVEWVTRDEAWPNPVCLSLYESLLLCLNLSDQHGQGLLDATSTLLHGCLKIGLSRTAYQNLLNDLGDRAVTVAGLSTVDWVLDIGEEILIHPCPDVEVRAALWIRLQSALTPVVLRLEVGQVALMEAISTALGLEPIRMAGSIEDQVEGGATPSGVLALYTLQEGVAQRVEAILKRIAPRLRIEVCTDLVATDRVKHLARTADRFIVCWQDAKHAVTQEISKLRPRQWPVQWAVGAGSSSILRMVRECRNSF